MAAYAEGLAVLKAANIGKKAGAVDAEPRRSAIPSTINMISTWPTLQRFGGAAA